MTATGGWNATRNMPKAATISARVSTAARVPGGTRRAGPPVSSARPTPASTANRADARPDATTYAPLTRPSPSAPGITCTVIIDSRATPRATSTATTRRPDKAGGAATVAGSSIAPPACRAEGPPSCRPAGSAHERGDRGRRDEDHEEGRAQQQCHDGGGDAGHPGVEHEGGSRRREGLDPHQGRQQ